MTKMPAPLLEAVSLSKSYPMRGGGLFGRRLRVHAVADVSLSLGEGEILGVVGESGCGKSTLGRLLTCIEPPTAGEVRWRGEKVSERRGAALRRLRSEIQMVFQDPYASLNPRMRLRQVFDEVLRIHTSLDHARRTARAAELMELVGMEPGHLDRFPHQFSGGQRQRLCVARALAVGAKLIVADEPVSALDVSVQGQVVNLFEDLRANLGLSLVFIAHDLAVVEHVSDRIAVMYLGRVVETGKAAELCASPAHPYTRALLDASPQIGRRNVPPPLGGETPSPLRPPPGCPFHPRCPRAEPRCASEMPPLAPRPHDACHLAACYFPLR